MNEETTLDLPLTPSQDWIGTKRSTFVTLGSSNHVSHARQAQDYYATEPRTVDELFAVESFNGRIWEPACGEGHLSERMKELGATVYSTDLIDRSYGDDLKDFLLEFTLQPKTHIITNPPYKHAQAFVEKSLDLIDDGYKVAMFLKLTFLEGQARYKMFKENPPKTIYVYSSRRKCAINGDFESVGSSAACYAWFVWSKGYKGAPEIKWII